jgi:hypothetical protein
VVGRLTNVYNAGVRFALRYLLENQEDAWAGQHGAGTATASTVTPGQCDVVRSSGVEFACGSF